MGFKSPGRQLFWVMLVSRLWRLGLAVRKLVQLAISDLQHSRRRRLTISLSAAATIALSGSNARAFDPTTIAGGIGGFVGGIDEGINVGFALTDLLTELEVAPESEEEVRKAVADLERLNSRVGEINGNQREVHQLLQMDLSKAKSLQEKLRAIKSMISASKRIAEIMGMRPKAGSYAAQVQQLKINSMMLDELQAIRRQMFLSTLDERQIKIRRTLLFERIVREEKNRNSRGLMSTSEGRL